MPVFESDQQLYTIMNDVFLEVSTHPENIEPFVRSNLVIRIRFDDPEAEILVDGRQPPMEVFYGPRPGKSNLEVSMSGDLLHAIWMGTESTSGSFFSGRIKTKGSLLKLMKLVDLFRECEAVYPSIAAKYALV
jgi:hypothetical protein